ncbi:WD40 repeat-like protein [Patellaria atrata CBS 101060]|uniref:WD40 repeat-like protein n=1 Tax=Patellaria atrata CBS 101060 TaxID=1346257 RepID=A0A9P4VM95_9PEZI|nr:WD40 repeat-like protein [Patellaria atrata CBS 101060]
MDTLQQRRNEILAKKAKLEELKRQRIERSKELAAAKQSTKDELEIDPLRSRADKQRDVNNIIEAITRGSRPSSTGPYDPSSPSAGRGSRPTSIASAGRASQDESDPSSPPLKTRSLSVATQTLSLAPLTVVYEAPSSPKREVITYSKGVQTSTDWSPPRRRSPGFGSDEDGSPGRIRSPRASKRLSRREREREEELRQNIRTEIEAELKALQQSGTDAVLQPDAPQPNFPARTLNHEELNAVETSEEFREFVERSTKVLERALDQEYDILANYAVGGSSVPVDEDGEFGPSSVREVVQFYDDRWSKKRMVSDIGFSPKFPELVLASYTKNPTAPHEPDGIIQVWNMHMQDRAEYIFHAQSDIIAAKFSPFHPNLIIGGAYSGQVLLWDTRTKHTPVQKTPLTGSGHTHPVYSIDIVGTQNANNIISCSTDGVVCGWSIDMLSQPQEYLELITPPPTKTEDMAPTCIAFPQSDPTYFLVGSEDGNIYPCSRYDRAGAKAGVDTRISYRGHSAPVMSLDFHPAKGPIDLGDLVLSSSIDWSVKLWKVRQSATSSTTSVTGTAQAASPLLDFTREDLVYSARWSPIKAGIFALVDGAGSLEVWDINADVEVPVTKTTPSNKNGSVYMPRSLNKLAWEPQEGKRIAVGGLDSVVTVFEVGTGLGGLDSVRNDEWTSMKKLVNRLENNVGVNGTR